MVSSELSSSAREAMVRDMCDLQQHGGPDGSGIFLSSDNSVVFGHRRLALLDLSPAGNQPMRFRDYLSITYNGELYNFRDLRQELMACGHQFKTCTDTEVILAAFDQWNTRAFSKFRGMFAFALNDERVKQVYLVRDPSGIKPLYFSQSFDSLVFASEIRAFGAVQFPYSEEPDWQVLLMAYGHIPEPYTTLREVRMLAKGCFLCYDYGNNKSELFTFSHYGFGYSGSVDRPSAIHDLRNKLKASVSSHLLADAPVRVFLGGGLDSSILFSLAASSGKTDFSALSVYFDDKGFSEKRFQDLMLRKTGKEGHQFRLTEDEFEASLPKILDDMDMPSCDGINTWFISKYARDSGLKAVISGVGADELFGGYPSFTRMGIADNASLLPDFLLKGGAAVLGGKFSRLAYLTLTGIQGIYLFLRGNFDPAGMARRLDMDESQVWHILKNQISPGSPGFLKGGNKASWMEMNLYMQNQLLRDSDVMSMKHGVEVRVPFLDEEVIRLSLGLSSSLKFEGPWPKQLMIDAFGDILLPEIWERPKMGFSLPYAQWLKRSNYISDLMGSRGLSGIKALKDFRENRLTWSQFLSLFMVQTHRAYA